MSTIIKAAIPWGNSLEYKDFSTDFYGVSPFDYRASLGGSLKGSYGVPPVDPVYNPAATDYSTTLIQPTSNEGYLLQYPGAFISHNSAYALSEGQQYTISVWLKPKYLYSNCQLKAVGFGDWTTGLQTQGSEGNFADASWKTLNGGYTLVTQNCPGSYGSGSSFIGDLGIPYFIPSQDVLFQKRADHILAAPGNGAASLKVIDPSNSGANTIYDLSSADSQLSSLVKTCKYATFIYQEITPSALMTNIKVDMWARVAKEVYGQGGTITLDNAKTGNIVAWGIVYTNKQGGKVCQVWKSYTTMDNNWRLHANYLPTLITNTSPSIDMDTTQPVGYGVWFVGDLAIYGGIRLQDATYFNSGFVGLNPGVWRRVSFTFTANKPMAQMSVGKNYPGFLSPFVLTSGFNTLSIIVTQPGQPKINGVNDPAYLPWSPYWAAVEAYGWMINPGATADVYEPDPPFLKRFIAKTPRSATVTHLPSHAVPTGGIVQAGSGAPKITRPAHPVGMNVCGNNISGTDRIFLNLFKASAASRYRHGIDPNGCWPTMPKCGWRIAPMDNSGTFSTVGTRLALVGVVFAAGNSYFTVPKATNASWQNFDGGWPDRRFVYRGTGKVDGVDAMAYTGVKVVSVATDPVDATLARYVVDAPFSGNASATLTDYYEIKRHVYDSYLDLTLNADGWPTNIPSGHAAWSLAYRSTPIFNENMRSFWSKMLPSGHYVLKWSGTGTVVLDFNPALSPPGYPVTVVSSGANRIVYNVDCSGNTASNQATSFRYAFTAEHAERFNARTGFVISITSTDLQDPVRDIVLVEEKYESLLESGDVFYPKYKDRLKNYQTLRFLDWTQTNNYQPYIYSLDERTKPSECSWYGGHIPWEIMIRLCNETQKDIWLPVHPNASDEFYLWLAKLLRDTLDPRLRIYISYGNEQWNGGLGTGWFIDLYAKKFNILGDQSQPNPAWENHMKTYGKLSQNCFNIFDSVFSGYAGLRHPVKLWQNPKDQPRRLIRLCSTNPGGSSAAQQAFAYAKPFCLHGRKIPYDMMETSGYWEGMGSKPDVVAKEASANPYQWSLDEIIGVSWETYHEITATAQSSINTLRTNAATSSKPDGLFGRDTDGEIITPGYCWYEWGYPAVGISYYMQYRILQIKWAEDGQNTLKNMYAQMFAFQKSIVATDTTRHKEDSCFNLWRTCENFGNASNWGIVNAAYMPMPGEEPTSSIT